MVRNWTYTLFFVLGELWGDVVLSLLFWGLANELTHMSEVCLRLAGVCTSSDSQPARPLAGQDHCSRLTVALVAPSCAERSVMPRWRKICCTQCLAVCLNDHCLCTCSSYFRAACEACMHTVQQHMIAQR